MGLAYRESQAKRFILVFFPHGQISDLEADRSPKQVLARTPDLPRPPVLAQAASALPPQAASAWWWPRASAKDGAESHGGRPTGLRAWLSCQNATWGSVATGKTMEVHVTTISLHCLSSKLCQPLV